MAGNRTIFDSDPHPAALLDELYFQVERGFLGVPLGQVAAHTTHRYTACYGALCVAHLLTELGAIEAVTSVTADRAAYQDKRTTREFPSAHAIPCDLLVTLPAQPEAVHLYDLLRNPLNQTWVQKNIFGQTDRVHRLVNVADQSCELATQGMTFLLAQSCEQVIRECLQSRISTQVNAPAPTLVADHFYSVLVPGFIATAERCLRRMESNLTRYELTEMRRDHLLDRFGKFFADQPADTRKTSSNPEARAAAKISLCQILRTYADSRLVDNAALKDITAKIGALRLNEKVR